MQDTSRSSAHPLRTFATSSSRWLHRGSRFSRCGLASAWTWCGPAEAPCARRCRGCSEYVVGHRSRRKGAPKSYRYIQHFEQSTQALSALPFSRLKIERSRDFWCRHFNSKMRPVKCSEIQPIPNNIGFAPHVRTSGISGHAAARTSRTGPGG